MSAVGASDSARCSEGGTWWAGSILREYGFAGVTPEPEAQSRAVPLGALGTGAFTEEVGKMKVGSFLAITFVPGTHSRCH